MKKKSTLSKVLGYIGRYKFLLPVSILLALITVALTLYVPVLIGDAITYIEDMISGAGTENTTNENVLTEIAKILGLAVILIGITALAQWLMSMLNNRIAYHVAKDVRHDAFSKIERLPLSYLDTKPHGDILSRTVTDTEQFSEGLLLGFTQLFTGVTPEHTPAHFVRSIMESVACMLKSNLDYLGVPVNEIRVMGGGAKSSVWCTMKADITGKKLLTLKNKEAACLGSAILAGVGAGVFASVEDACRLIATDRVYTPTGANYDEVYKSFVKYDSILNVRKED